MRIRNRQTSRKRKGNRITLLAKFFKAKEKKYFKRTDNSENYYNTDQIVQKTEEMPKTN